MRSDYLYYTMEELLEKYPPPKTKEELNKFYYKIPDTELIELGDIMVTKLGWILQAEVAWSVAGVPVKNYTYFSFYRKRKTTPKGNRIVEQETTYEMPVLHGW